MTSAKETRIRGRILNRNFQSLWGVVTQQRLYEYDITVSSCCNHTMDTA